jgi:hypothetical protein
MRVRPTKLFPLVPSSDIPELNQHLVYSWVYRLGTPFGTYAQPHNGRFTVLMSEKTQ